VRNVGSSGTGKVLGDGCYCSSVDYTGDGGGVGSDGDGNDFYLRMVVTLGRFGPVDGLVHVGMLALHLLALLVRQRLPTS